MLTYIELHLITYFTMLLFFMLIIKMFLKTQANTLSILFSSIMFAIIKFLLDFYHISIIFQLIILGALIISATLCVHKLNHISKLIISAIIFMIYYLCLSGLNYFITVVWLKQNINYISNYYLFLILGFNFIIFSIIGLIIYYLQAQKELILTQRCTLTIANTNISLLGYVDTGNCLVEKYSGKSVVIIKLDSIKKYITDKMYCDLLFATNFSNYFNKITKQEYETIGSKSSLTIFKPDKFMVNGKLVDCFVGISIRNLKYDVVLSSACI